MSDGEPRVTVPLPIPDEPDVPALFEAWPWYAANYPHPRSRWLHDFEAILRRAYPQASSDQLTLTARNLAPFPLALPNVP